MSRNYLTNYFSIARKPKNLTIQLFTVVSGVGIPPQFEQYTIKTTITHHS